MGPEWVVVVALVVITLFVVVLVRAFRQGRRGD
jgi:hypothetical protein